MCVLLYLINTIHTKAGASQRGYRGYGGTQALTRRGYPESRMAPGESNHSPLSPFTLRDRKSVLHASSPLSEFDRKGRLCSADFKSLGRLTVVASAPAQEGIGDDRLVPLTSLGNRALFGCPLHVSA